MWDMTRDADIPAGRYIDFVHRHAPNESLPTIVDDLLSQAIGAVENFTHPSHRRAARAHLHETAATILAAATPGSPLQLSALRCTLATSDAPEDFDFAAGLLAGRFVPDGITIDQDLRWLITRRLAAAGRLDNTAIDAEAARDNTDVGARKAAAARASRPHPDAKASAWARIIDRATTLAMQRALIGGIQERDQQELLEPYIERWAEQVPRYWRERASEEAEVFTQGMYPAYRADDVVIATADRLLEGSELNDAGRRLVVESRDSTLRQQRAQAADRAAGVGAQA
jgi:aminopeptidase N